MRSARCFPISVSAVIYLDNAATTYPKPPQVYRVWQNAMTAFGANPGRAGYRFSAATSEAVYAARERCAALFGAQPENTVFTLNCTHSLNFAIKGLARRGGHFVCSDMEHNAVIRPIHAAAEHFGGSYTLFEVTEDEEQTVRGAERAIKPDTCCFVCTAAGNVSGLRPPIKALAELCRKRGIPFVLDAAQGAGTIPIMVGNGVSFVCASGHKGLYGPMGTGLLISDGSRPLNTIIEGGTGSASESILQPEFTPDRFESGTINTAGAIALGAGAAFVAQKTPAAILKHELALCRRFCSGARRLPQVVLYNNITDRNDGLYAPVVSFNLLGMSSTECSARLSNMGIYLRGGLHCAPLAHKKLGTLDTGTVRFAPSVFSSESDVDALLAALRRLS